MATRFAVVASGKLHVRRNRLIIVGRREIVRKIVSAMNEVIANRPRPDPNTSTIEKPRRHRHWRFAAGSRPSTDR
jgi:hypothetical protein